MSLRTAVQVVQAAHSVLGCKYWYACSGETPTAAWLDYKIRQYPDKWTPARIAKARSEVGKGKHVFDCIGLMRWICGVEKNRDALYTNADGLLTKCKIKGPIKTLPEVPGVMVFMKGHVGVYIGKGRVIESHGFKQVDNNPLSFQKWTHWGYCPWVQYPSTPAPDKPIQGPTEDAEGFVIGDRVRIKTNALRYYPGGVNVPGWLRGQVKTVDQVLVAGKPKVLGGEQCILLDAKGINSWISVKNIDKVRD